MGRLRLFLAIELPAATREIVARAAVEAGLPERAKRVRPELLHLTLRFLGDTDEERLPAITGALEAIAAERPAFSLAIEGAGTFGAPRRPRILYAALRPEPALGALAAAFEERLIAAGLPPADKPFSPHLTLARSRDPRGDEGLQTAASGLRTLRCEPFLVDEVVLFRSELRPEGPRHTALSRARLRGGTDDRPSHPH